MSRMSRHSNVSSIRESSETPQPIQLSDINLADQPTVTRPTHEALRAVTEGERKKLALPELNFKPIVLRRGSLILVISFFAICFLCLILLGYYQYLESTSVSGWFTIRILPAVMGTVTSSCCRSIVMNLARITPYAKCAKNGSARGAKKEMASTTFMDSYSPAPSWHVTFRSGEVMLILGMLLWLLSDFVIPLKSAILNTSRYDNYSWTAEVAIEFLYPLLGIYGVLILYLCALLFHTWTWETGLRWDPASIADYLVLFCHSDFLNDFENLDVDDAEDKRELFSNSAYRLGYWLVNKNGSEHYWHGLHETTPETPPTRAVECPSADVCYSTMHPIFHLKWMGWWITLWVILSGCFATLFVMGFQHYDSGFSLPCNFLLAVFLLQLLPTFLAGQFTIFWEEADLYYRQTQAYVGMRKQRKQQQPQPAYENLLLEYPCLPALIISYIALQKKHYKVALISLMALVQRLLPIIAAGSVTLSYSGDQYDATVVWVNPISCGSTLAFILLEFPLIFLARPGPERRLPHKCETIGDMLSWCWDSELVRNQAFDITIPKERVLFGDGLNDRRLMKAGLLWSRGEYAFGEINKDNYRADGNETAGRIRFGFDEKDRITIPIPKRRPWRLCAKKREKIAT